MEDDVASACQWLHSVDCGLHASQIIPLYFTTVTINTHHCPQTVMHTTEYYAISHPELLYKILHSNGEILF